MRKEDGRKKKVLLATDGACLGNPGPGGWAALLKSGKHEKLVSGSEMLTTNNRMELMAVIQGLKALKRSCDVKVLTDSKYVMEAFTKGWIDSWQQNGWRTSSKSEVKNQDLWELLIAEVDGHDVEWEWVKGHAGHPENEIVDAEARRMAEVASTGA